MSARWLVAVAVAIAVVGAVAVAWSLGRDAERIDWHER